MMSCRTARLSAWITSFRGDQVGDFEVATGGGIWVATGDPSITRFLSMSQERLEGARADLIRTGLIAYTRPLYQVLSLEPSEPPRISGVRSASALLSRSSWLPDRQRRS
jgi:hypothetical protein